MNARRGERLIVVHGHAYQPPREDPWSGEVPLEASAAPFHDWNERILTECYAPNTHARVLDATGAVVGERNNYEHVSFDLAPTLARWLRATAPTVHDAIVAADRAGHARVGHGPAIAHPGSHAILPLATAAERDLLVAWGVAEFVARFGRRPEGMWLPETAVDLATLETLAAHRIAFTILAPHQLALVRSGPDEPWSSDIDHDLPYRIALPSGATMIVLTYDGALSTAIAFDGLLHDGRDLAARLVSVAESARAVVAAATDFETYGHHHRFGEMALAATFDVIAATPGVRLATAAEAALTIAPHEALLAERTAWSCAHGIERWRSDCSCRMDPNAGDQQWRTPLRRGLDWLRDTIMQLPELASDLADPSQARSRWVDVLVDPTAIGAFDAAFVTGTPDRAHAWLALQEHLLMMMSSCGWFFDDAAGLETRIVLRHAARAIELVRALDGPDLEAGLVEHLGAMRSQARPDLDDGTAIWRAATA